LTTTSERLAAVTENLEFKIDTLADGVHKLEQHRETADRVAGRILQIAATKLEERDREIKRKEGTEKVPMLQVLQGLAGVMAREGR
jgi:kinetochore protein Mis13/DSN1